MKIEFLTEEQNRADQAAWQAFEQQQPWGLSTTIDLYECQPSLIRDEQIIRNFNEALCQHLRMTRYGDFHLARFGKGDLYGYSGMQFIETSDVTMHFIEPSDDACIDVFSCSFYAPHAAAEFCKVFFGAKTVALTYTLRGRRTRAC